MLLHVITQGDIHYMSLKVVMVGRRPQFPDYLFDKLNEKGVEFSLIDSQTEDGTDD